MLKLKKFADVTDCELSRFPFDQCSAFRSSRERCPWVACDLPHDLNCAFRWNRLYLRDDGGHVKRLGFLNHASLNLSSIDESRLLEPAYSPFFQPDQVEAHWRLHHITDLTGLQGQGRFLEWCDHIAALEEAQVPSILRGAGVLAELESESLKRFTSDRARPNPFQ